MIDLAIVDDDPLFRIVTSKMMNGFDNVRNVRMFEDGEEAIEFILGCINSDSPLPDMILLDLNMPVMDGWQFISAYLPLRPYMQKVIKIYIITSSIDESDRQKAASIPAVNGYMIKPISKDRLQEVLIKYTRSN